MIIKKNGMLRVSVCKENVKQLNVNRKTVLSNKYGVTK